MSRSVKTLTPEQVFQCADQLVSEGKNPTIAALRERLGSGSVTTIHKYLSQWKTQQGQKSGASVAPPSDYPALLRAIQAEIDRAGTLARTPLQEEIAALKNDVGAWTREIERLDGERETLRDQLEQMTSERNALEGRLLGRTEELSREMSLLRQELEKERKEKAEAREKAAELWGRLTSDPISQNSSGSSRRRQGKPTGEKSKERKTLTSPHPGEDHETKRGVLSGPLFTHNTGWV